MLHKYLFKENVCVCSCVHLCAQLRRIQQTTGNFSDHCPYYLSETWSKPGAHQSGKAQEFQGSNYVWATTPALRLQTQAIMPGFYISSGDANSGPQACSSTSKLTRLTLHSLDFFSIKIYRF